MKKEFDCYICGTTFMNTGRKVGRVVVWNRNVCSNPKCNETFDKLSDEDLKLGRR